MTDLNAIRDAVHAIADTAHPPQRIRAAIDGRYRHHQQRRVLLRVAGATAAAAVTGAGGIGVYRLAQRGEPEFPFVAGGPGGGWLRAAPRWRPGWLPDGFGLTRLGAVIDGDRALVVSREWKPSPQADGDPPQIALSCGERTVYAPPATPLETTERVDIGGVPGEYIAFPETGSWLVWRPPGSPELTLATFLGDAARERAVALRVARSLHRDPATFPVGPRPGWLPEPYAAQPWMFSLFVQQDTWYQSFHVSGGTPAAGGISISTGPQVGEPFDTDRAEAVTVRGAAAWLENGRNLYVPPIDGTGVLATTEADGIAVTDLVRLVEDFDLGPVPDMSWYGAR